MVVIGSARIGERGRLSGGKAGDQKQGGTPDYRGEVSLQSFYVHSKGWDILRAKDAVNAKRIAINMQTACNNINIGYSQSDRMGAVKNGVSTKIKCNTDCSALVRACVKEATGKDPGDFSTLNEAKTLMATGLFEKHSYKAGCVLYTGDILVTKTKGHTAIVVEGENRTTKKDSNPYKEPKKNVTSTENAKKRGIKDYISSGTGVKWVQFELVNVSSEISRIINGSGGVDGVCGSATVKAIEAFQKAKGLNVDGVCGVNTRSKLKND